MTYFCLTKSPKGWRWSATRGGRVIATSGASYKELRKAYESLDNLLASVANGSVRFTKGAK